MEDRNAVSRRKLQKVLASIREPTRAKLKIIAGFQGVPMWELLDTLANDYIRGWEKLNKLDLDKLQAARGKPAVKKASKRVKR